MVIHHQRRQTLKAILNLPCSFTGPGGTKTDSGVGGGIVIKVRNAWKRIKLVLSALTVLPLQTSFGNSQQLLSQVCIQVRGPCFLLQADHCLMPLKSSGTESTGSYPAGYTETLPKLLGDTFGGRWGIGFALFVVVGISSGKEWKRIFPFVDLPLSFHSLHWVQDDKVIF